MFSSTSSACGPLRLPCNSRQSTKAGIAEAVVNIPLVCTNTFCIDHHRRRTITNGHANALHLGETFQEINLQRR